MGIENTVKEIIIEELGVKPEEIVPDQTLVDSLNIDSTELTDISLKLKKALSIEIGDGELQKTHSFNQIVDILKSKTAVS